MTCYELVKTIQAHWLATVIDECAYTIFITMVVVVFRMVQRSFAAVQMFSIVFLAMAAMAMLAMFMMMVVVVVMVFRS